MMIDIGRLFASSFNASASRVPLAWMVGHKLWYRSWHQVPAASLPDDDEELCHLAELGADLKSFKSARGLAMRGWVRCSDGRLYHPVIAEAALDAWLRKLEQRMKSGKGNDARAKKEGRELPIPFDPRPIQARINVAADMLAQLNPHSKTASRIRRSAEYNAPLGHPTGTPTGSLEGSQETETGIETGTGVREEYPYQEGAEVIQLGGARG